VAIVGNIRFRNLVADAIPNYSKAITRLEKSIVVQQIIDTIHSEGGKFLKLSSGYYSELTVQQCKDKCSHGELSMF
jgi:hypothetical protein